MRAIRNLLWFLVGFLGIFVVGLSTAKAATSPRTGIDWMRVADVNNAATYSRNFAAGELPNTLKVPIEGVGGYNNIETLGNGLRMYRTMSLMSDGASGAIIRAADVGLTKSVSAVAVDAVVATAPAIAAAGRFAIRNALPLVGAGIMAWDLYEALEHGGLEWDDDAGTLVKQVHDEQSPSPGGWTYNQPDGQSDVAALRKHGFPSGSPLPADCPSPESCYNASAFLSQPCPNGQTGQREIDLVSAVPGSYSPTTQFESVTVRYEITVFCPNQQPIGPTPGSGVDRYKSTLSNSCPAGYIFNNTIPACVRDYSLPATDDDIEEAIEAAPAVALPTYVEEIAEKGDGTLQLPKTAASTLAFPDSQYDTSPTVKTTTKTNPDGSTTTTREETIQRVKPTVQGDTISNQTTTVTVTTITNTYVDNELQQQEEQDNPPPLQQPDVDDSDQPDQSECDNGGCDFTDSAFPAIPELYHQKYPDGIAGVWAAKSAELQATAFIEGITSMFPNFSGGACPSFSLDLNFGKPGNFGSFNVDIQCWVLQICGLIILATACFTAWWIIF